MKYIGQHTWDQVSSFRNDVFAVSDHFYVTSDSIRFMSNAANDPLVQIRNFTNDATGPRLRFMKSRTTGFQPLLSGITTDATALDGQDEDVCGIIQFYSHDDGTPSTQKYASIQGLIHDATNGQESGKLELNVASHDGDEQNGLVLTGGDADTLVDVTIANGAASTTTIAGNLTITGSLNSFTFDSVGVTRITTSAESFADNDTSLMTSAAIDDRILSYGYSTATGDITGVTAGTNLSGGGASGAVTINLADASTSAKGAASFSSDNFAVSSGAVTIKNGGVDLSAEVTGVLESTHLDADTSHLSVAQTFTAAKTFGTTTKLEFRDSNSYIHSPTANDLKISATDILLDAAGPIYLDAGAANAITFQEAGTTIADISAHHAATYLQIYENEGASTDDYLQIKTAAAGATTITTVDAAGTDADLDFAIDGTFSVASTGIDIATDGTITNATWQGAAIATTYTAAKVTSIVAGDGIDVSGATGDVTVTAETATDSNPGVVELATTGEADTGTDTARAVTPAGLKSHVDLRYSYVYMTWSASATSSMDGSDPEWVFPNTAKGIYEEDWTKDENIKATSVGTTTYTTSRHTAVNALVIPHTGVCVGFHAHGRNNNNDNSGAFKAGLFHYDGSSTSTTNASGIDYGATGSTHECTLRWIATAVETEASGGADGTSSHSFKGPCKLVSNDDALAVSAGDALLPAIMGPDGSDEIFVTMTIILKIPLTT